jgi:diguanylate cyclase (GGDEF)-like protein
MKKTEQQHLTALETKGIVDALEQAILEHGKWLSNCHRSLLCSLPFPHDVLADKAYEISNFGKWYYKQTTPILTEHPLFRSIDAANRDLHQSAKALAGKIKKTEKISQQEYDEFLIKEVTFSGILIKLRDEFHQALFSFDSLTHVLNRQAFLRILTQEYARASRLGKPCCIAMVDLDHFKVINDTYGHQIGDTVLHAVAQFMTSNLRPYDSMCRYGGEEFLICLPYTPVHLARTTLTRLQKGLAALAIIISPKIYVKITASFGLVTTDPGVTMIDTITRADSAMYAAKHGGGNQVVIWGDKA